MNSALFAKQQGVVTYTDAALDLSSSTGLLVVAGGNGLILNTSTTVPAIGIVLDGVTAGRPNSIGILGAALPPVRMVANGVIAQFARVIQSATGGVVTDTLEGASRVVVGVALEAATAAGQYIIVAPLAPVEYTAD